MVGALSFLAFLINEIATYVAYISNNSFPKPLSKEKEEEYLLKMQEGDSRARRVLIERNLRLVAHMIKRICTRYKHLIGFQSYLILHLEFIILLIKVEKRLKTVNIF